MNKLELEARLQALRDHRALLIREAEEREGQIRSLKFRCAELLEALRNLWLVHGTDNCRGCQEANALIERTLREAGEEG